MLRVTRYAKYLYEYISRDMFYLKNLPNLKIIRHISRSTFYFKSSGSPSLSSKNTVVPAEPVSSKINLNLLPSKTVIDVNTIALLEKLSLVDCANKQGIRILEDAIEFADQILQVDTSGILPLVTVLEDRPLKLREDNITEGSCRNDILSNTSLTEEEYLVAPPGNIPLEPRENLLHEEKTKVSI